MADRNSTSRAVQSGGQRPPAAFLQRPPRARTYLAGKLVYSGEQFTPEGAFTLDCTIRDISEGGAKVTLGTLLPLPLDLYLIVVKRCVAYRAKVVWLNAPTRGLKFSQGYLLNGTAPGSLGFLQNLWNELTLRGGGDMQPLSNRSFGPEN